MIYQTHAGTKHDPKTSEKNNPDSPYFRTILLSHFLICINSNSLISLHISNKFNNIRFHWPHNFKWITLTNQSPILIRIKKLHNSMKLHIEIFTQSFTTDLNLMLGFISKMQWTCFRRESHELVWSINSIKTADTQTTKSESASADKIETLMRFSQSRNLSCGELVRWCEPLDLQSATKFDYWK